LWRPLAPDEANMPRSAASRNRQRQRNVQKNPLRVLCLFHHFVTDFQHHIQHWFLHCFDWDFLQSL
jgi:hypothetical protein